jgi:hypothetical protein
VPRQASRTQTMPRSAQKSRAGRELSDRRRTQSDIGLLFHAREEGVGGLFQSVAAPCADSYANCNDAIACRARCCSDSSPANSSSPLRISVEM